MIRKTAVILCLSILLLLGLFIWLPIRWTVSRSVGINASIFKVAYQINDLRHWNNWYPELMDSSPSAFSYSLDPASGHPQVRNGKICITLNEINPEAVQVRDSSGTGDFYFSLYAVPDSEGRTSRLNWDTQVSALGWIREKWRRESLASRSLANLKSFMEDPFRYYGFRIALLTVPDSLVLTSTRKSSRKERLTTLKELYSRLSRFAQIHHLNDDADSPRMAGFQQVTGDSVICMAGIPVVRHGPPQEGIAYLQMPPKGKMLVGYYQGNYAGLINLYRAMNQYIADKHLQQIAVPYEKYMFQPVTPADSLHMVIELHYPIL